MPEPAWFCPLTTSTAKWPTKRANSFLWQAKTTTGTSLTNTSAVAGSTYYYKVRAVDANGNKSDFSAAKST